MAVKIMPIRTASDSKGELVDHNSEPLVIPVLTELFQVDVPGIVTDVSTLYPITGITENKTIKTVMTMAAGIRSSMPARLSFITSSIFKHEAPS